MLTTPSGMCKGHRVRKTNPRATRQQPHVYLPPLAMSAHGPADEEPIMSASARPDRSFISRRGSGDFNVFFFLPPVYGDGFRWWYRGTISVYFRIVRVHMYYSYQLTRDVARNS